MKTQIEPHRILTLWTAETESHIQLPSDEVIWRARRHDDQAMVPLPMIPQYKFGIVLYRGKPTIAYARGWQEVETLELMVALDRYMSDHGGFGPYPDALHKLLRIALQCGSNEIVTLRDALKSDDQSGLGEDGVRELIG